MPLKQLCSWLTREAEPINEGYGTFFSNQLIFWFQILGSGRCVFGKKGVYNSYPQNHDLTRIAAKAGSSRTPIIIKTQEALVRQSTLISGFFDMAWKRSCLGRMSEVPIISL